MSNSEKAIIVTGGTKGLGRALTLSFGRAGYYVLALYHSDEQAAKETEQALKEVGGQGRVLRMDVTESAAETLTEVLGEVNRSQWVVIHNAVAPFQPKAMHLHAWDDFERSFSVAVKGGFQCYRAVIRSMIQKKSGTLINVLSTALEGPPPRGFSSYVVAKYGLLGFTRSLASEYGHLGLRIFSVSPSYMETPLTKAWADHFRSGMQSSGQSSSPEHVATRVLELVEDESLPAKGENYTFS